LKKEENDPAKLIEERENNSTEALLDVGLSETEVEKRHKKFGYNEVPEKKTSFALAFAKKFWGTSAWMLEIIVFLSLFLRRYADAYIVTGLLLFNAAVGFIEEQRASKVVETLKEKLQVNARVFRDKKWKVLSSRELVPDDVIRLRSGDFVPADIKIMAGGLRVDQSALTGESLLGEKNPNDLLYSGSIIKQGEAYGLVSSIGIQTYFGRSAQLVELAKPKLHIEEVISNVVKWLFAIVAVLIGISLAFSFLRDLNLLDILPIALVVLLSAIPVALPAMFTVTMSLGAKQLAKKGVLVTRLSAAEDAATMNVLCTDKTGTITMNKLSIAKVLPVEGFTRRDVILYGALASQEANQDPIDLAFINSAREENILLEDYTQRSFSPFSPMNRRTEAIVQNGSTEFKVIKGAVGTIADLSELDNEKKYEIIAQMNEYAQKGYRTLAVAKTEKSNKSRIVGLSVLYDKPRKDSKKLIMELKKLGISVKMLTGDALPIAKEVAKGVELGDKIISAQNLKACIIEDPIEAGEEAENSDGFAEVYPEDKYTIVKSLQSRRKIVGMTGDGVNDAPALRQSEVGIAVSNATDVAKSAASVVLTNEGLSSIIDLVKNGREVYERITAWILSKIIRTIQVSAFTVVAFLLTGSYVISAFAIIVYFFLTDFVKIALSTDNFTGSDKPDTWNISGVVKAGSILGFLVLLESFFLLYIVTTYFGVEYNDPIMFTFTFEILFYSAILVLLNVRERRHFWKTKPSKELFLAMVASLIVGTLLVTVGIPNLPAVSISQTFWIFSFSILFALGLNDLIKVEIVKNSSLRW
jgi:H+-transporting ATPase